MDQQAAERAKVTSATSEDQPVESPSDATGGLISADLKQEHPLPMSPQQTMDEASLMVTLDKNKETLKRKLMMRRSLNELVDQGIYPSPKTPQAFMEQRKGLERAKIGDTLRFKISHRPDRQQLVLQHILEDTNIDSSLHEHQQQLKKSLLADNLNDKLSHRPGAPELVQGNIIQTEHKLHQHVKEGSLPFDKVNDLEINEDMAYGFDDSKSSDDTSSDHSDDSNQSLISISPVTHISVTPELPTSFAKALTFPAQIQLHQDSKVTVPLSTQQFSIPLQTTGSGTFTFSASSGSFFSTRSNVTGSTINNNIKSRPKKQKPKPQSKAKIIKFHEYKGPPNVVKCSLPVTSAAPVMSTAALASVVTSSNAIATHQHENQHLQQQQQSDMPYHVLLQQQQLYLQWQLEFSQKNLNASTVLVRSQKEDQSGSHTSTSNVGSMHSSSSMSNIIASAAEAAAVTMATPVNSHTRFIVSRASQYAQPATQVKQICISSPVVTQVKQEPQVGQPLPQMNPNIPPVTTKQPIRRATVNVNSGTAKVYSSLEEMKVAELKAELKKRNLTISGPKPQLIERLKPYADAIIKSPSGSVTSPSSSIVSASGSIISSRAGASPQPFSALSSMNSVASPDTIAIPSKTAFISTSASVMSSSASETKISLSVLVPTMSYVLSQPNSVHSNFVTQKSPGSSAGSVTSPASTSNAGSVFSKPGSVMSPLGSVIDETLCSNAESPLPSIQSMQSAVSVSNMALMPEDLSNPFSLPSSPLYMENVMTPVSPDIMDTHVASPEDSFSRSSANIYQFQTINQAQQNRTSNAGKNTELSEPSSVVSSIHADVDNVDLEMDDDIDMNDSLSSKVGPFHVALGVPVPLLPYSEVSQRPGIIQQQHDDQYQILRHIQIQLALLQECQKQQQKQQQMAATSYQLSHEELLKQQQEKIEKLQAQLEESQLRLQLQQLQHQQLQQQQQQLQKLQQQQIQQQAAHQQIVQLHQASTGTQVPISQSSVSPQQAMQTHSQVLQTAKTEPQLHQPMPAQSQSSIHIQASVQMQLQSIIKTQPQMSISKNSHIGQPAVVSISQTPLMPTKTSPQKVLQQSSQKQKPATAVQPLIFSVPNLPNGIKAPTLANLPSNMKQIQIPAHLLHSFQTAQGVPAVFVTHNPKTSAKANSLSLEFFRNQAINQSLNLAGGKSLIAVSSTSSAGSAVSTSSAGTCQFISTTPALATSSAVPQLSSSSPTLSGLAHQPVQKIPSSSPTLPVEGHDQSIGSSSSKSYFTPMKEPPRYDDAVHTKYSKSAESVVQEIIEKSQTIDDVLEILIRTGELPPGFVNETPPTYKTTSQSLTIPTLTVSQSNMVSLPKNVQLNQSVVLSSLANQISSIGWPINSHSDNLKGNSGSVSKSLESVVTREMVTKEMVTRETANYTIRSKHYSESKSDFDFNNIKLEVSLGSSEVSDTINSSLGSSEVSDTINSSLGSSDVSDTINSVDLFYFNDMMNCDLSAMDWTCDPSFADLDLKDTTSLHTAMDLMRNEQSLLSMPTVKSPQQLMHDGSEPDLTNLELADVETNYNMQLDVPDWLDVIMPNTGLTSLNAHVPISFPVDPILTLQTQRDMFDLFNFDESDFNMPLDFNCGNSSWDKLTETTSS